MTRDQRNLVTMQVRINHEKMLYYIRLKLSNVFVLLSIALFITPMKVINAFAKSTSPTKAMDAETVLNNMVDSYHKGNGDAKPSLRTFGTVLNACAYTDNGSKKEKAAAFKVARRCFKEIISGDIGQPNSITFSLFILSCIKLVPPGTKRDQLLSSVFDECCKRGLVDVKIILDIRRSSPLLRRKLLQSANLENGSIHINDIPAEWRSNIR